MNTHAMSIAKGSVLDFTNILHVYEYVYATIIMH